MWRILRKLFYLSCLLCSPSQGLIEPEISVRQARLRRSARAGKKPSRAPNLINDVEP